jgi:4-oxalocrotonate tautomerase
MFFGLKGVAAYRPCLSTVSGPDALVPYSAEALMPLIQVKVIEDVFTEVQKREIVRKLTDAMVSIEGENMRPVTWVVVEEVKSGDWGIGGKPLTTADVKALAAGKSAG